VFGFSLSELIVVIVVALVVIGPKDLPMALRTAGRWIAKVRRVSNHFRIGVETMIREAESLADPIAEIRKLARGELDAVTRAVDIKDISGSRPADISAREAHLDGFHVVRDREYPRDGADSCGALPDNAIVYAEGLPRSKLARDPLYVLGDPQGVLPDEVPPPIFGDDLRPPEMIAAEEKAAAEPAEPARDPSEAETMDPPAVAERSANEAH